MSSCRSPTCANFIVLKQQQLLTIEFSTTDPQAALILLCLCGSFWMLVHLSRSTPTSFVLVALHALPDTQCFAECTGVVHTTPLLPSLHLSLPRLQDCAPGMIDFSFMPLIFTMREFLHKTGLLQLPYASLRLLETEFFTPYGSSKNHQIWHILFIIETFAN